MSHVLYWVPDTMIINPKYPIREKNYFKLRTYVLCDLTIAQLFTLNNKNVSKERYFELTTHANKFIVPRLDIQYGGMKR